MEKQRKSNPIQVQKFLKGLDYPVNKQTIIQQAKKNKADKEVLDLLNHLEDQEYNSPVEISKAVSQEA